MKKTLIILLGLFSLSQIAFAGKDGECDATWNNSSAAQSCGTVCTNPINVYHYPFTTTYDAKTDQCTFNAGCCEGLPYQICSYDSAVCDPSSITVKRGDSQFQNVYGQLKHN